MINMVFLIIITSHGGVEKVPQVNMAQCKQNAAYIDQYNVLTRCINGAAVK